MKYTPEELSEMSDFDINKEVARLFLECDYIYENEMVEIIGVTTFLGAYGEPEERQVKHGEFNPCNDPNDIMPIALESDLCFKKIGPVYFAYHRVEAVEEMNNNLYRAFCHCIILMKQGEG